MHFPCWDKRRSCIFFLATVSEEGCNMDAERIKTTWTTQKINDMLTLAVDEHKEAAAGSMPDAK